MGRRLHGIGTHNLLGVYVHDLLDQRVRHNLLVKNAEAEAKREVGANCGEVLWRKRNKERIHDKTNFTPLLLMHV